MLKDQPIPGFFGGLNYFVRGDLIEDTQLTSMRNLISEQGELKVDNGYIFEDPEISGDPEISATYTLFDQNGIEISFVWTIDKLYYWTGVWTEIKDSSGYSLNDTARAASQLTGSGRYPLKIISFAGSSSGDTSGHNMVIFTNGVDPVHKIYYNGSSWICDSIQGLLDINVTTAHALTVWKDSVWVGNLREDGEDYTYRIRQCVPTNEEQWDESTYSSASYYDILGKADAIYSLEPLADYLIAYRARSIWRGTWTGSYVQPYFFDRMVADTGIVGQESVANMDDWHIIITDSGIFKYTGDRSLDPIGDLIHNRVFGTTSLIEYQSRPYISGIYQQSKQEVWLVFPNKSNNESYVLRYRIRYGVWTERYYPFYITNIGSLHPEQGDTWSGGNDDQWLTGNTLIWLFQNFFDVGPFVYLTTNTAAYKHYLIRYDYEQEMDGALGTYDASGDVAITPGSGSNVSWYFTTKDFRDIKGYFSTECWDFELKGDADTVITVEYSLDRGTTWHTYGTITLTTTPDSSEDYQMYTVWGNIYCKSIRFKLSGSGGNVCFAQANREFHVEHE